MRQVLIATVLAATLLGTGCVNRRQAAGVYVSEPMVETGVFTPVARGAPSPIGASDSLDPESGFR
jgi:hypothetical protein